MSRITATPEQLQEIAQAAQEVERERGIPADQLMSIFSFETAGTFDPWKAGPTTQWGQHRGLIQWGEPQARQYGVTATTPIRDQVFAAADYLEDRGYKPGMALENMYAAVLAGNALRTGVGDLHNGGVARSAAHAVETQFGPHTAAASEVLNQYGGPPQFGPSFADLGISQDDFSQFANVPTPTRDAQVTTAAIPPTPQFANVPNPTRDAQVQTAAVPPQPQYAGVSNPSLAPGTSVASLLPVPVASVESRPLDDIAVAPSPRGGISISDIWSGMPAANAGEVGLYPTPRTPQTGYGGRGELSPQQVASMLRSSGSSVDRVPSFELSAERLPDTGNIEPLPSRPTFGITPAAAYTPQPDYGGRGEMSSQQVSQLQNQNSTAYTPQPDYGGRGEMSSQQVSQLQNQNSPIVVETTPRPSETFETRYREISVPNPAYAAWESTYRGSRQKSPTDFQYFAQDARELGVGLGPVPAPPPRTITRREPYQVARPAPPVGVTPPRSVGPAPTPRSPPIGPLSGLRLTMPQFNLGRIGGGILGALLGGPLGGLAGAFAGNALNNRMVRDNERGFSGGGLFAPHAVAHGTLNEANPNWSDPTFGVAQGLGGSGSSAHGAFYDSIYGNSNSDSWSGGDHQGHDPRTTMNATSQGYRDNMEASGGKSGSSGGCFITTAICESLDKPDDCEELQILRDFRDNVMRKDASMSADIQQYYEIAPQVVEEIDRRPNKKGIYKRMREEYLIPAVEAIKNGDNKAAYEIYRGMLRVAVEELDKSTPDVVSSGDYAG
jgi:hypothetical protein